MSVTWRGLVFGDDGTGYVIPTYAALRDAGGTYLRKLRSLPSLNLEPASFFGTILDFGVSILHAGAQSAADAANKVLWVTASGVSLDQLLTPVTTRLAARASTAEVYAYGTPLASVPISSIARTSPTATAFTFGVGVTIPLAAAARSWVFELDVFAAGGASGVTFTLTVNGTPFVVVAGPGDDSTDIRDNLVSQVNAAALTQVAYPAGVRPDGSRIAGLVREESGGGPFPVLFVDSGPATSAPYPAASDTVTCSQTGPIAAPAESLRFGQGFAGIEGYVNVEAAAVGRNEETDSQMKARHLQTQRRGAGNPDAIRSALLTPVDQGGAGCTYASVEYNSSDITDAVGNLPHSIRVIVDADADTATVERVIWEQKAAGDQMNGAIAGVVLDAEGNAQNVLHDILETLYIWCDIEVETGEGWPVTGDPLAQLRQDVADWINLLGGGKDVRVNDAPVSLLADGTPRGVANFIIRVGFSTDPLGLAPPISYLDYWPDPEPDASLASIAITGRQVAESSLARVTAIFL